MRAVMSRRQFHPACLAIIEPLRPQQRTGVGRLQLHRDRDGFALSLQAAAQDIVDVQPAADAGCVAVRTGRRISRWMSDHDRIGQARHFEGQIFGDGLGEVGGILPADAGQRQDGDGVLAHDGAALLPMPKPEPERTGERDRGRHSGEQRQRPASRGRSGRRVVRRAAFALVPDASSAGRLDRGCVEQVAAPRNGLDQALAVIPEGGSKLADALYQRVVGHGHIGPHRLDQFVLGEQAAGTAGEVGEQCEGFRAQGNGRAANTQLALVEIDHEFLRSAMCREEPWPACRRPWPSASFSRQFRRSFGTLSGVAASKRPSSPNRNRTAAMPTPCLPDPRPDRRQLGMASHAAKWKESQ